MTLKKLEDIIKFSGDKFKYGLMLGTMPLTESLINTAKSKSMNR